MASQSALVFAAFALSAALAACVGDPVFLGGGSADGGGEHDGGLASEGGGGQEDAFGPCTTSADCPAQQECGFRDDTGANACSGELGQCFTPDQVVCASVLLGCACDGTEVNLVCNGLPTGYADKPIAHTGACRDGSFGADADADGGFEMDAAGPCTTSADCPSPEVCGFPENTPNACSGEQGQCFSPQAATCNAFEPGCACDGTVVNLICNGLPLNYATKPVAHTGLCTDGSSRD